MSDNETILYGIANCDQVKKARAWLVQHGISYRFHDFKKSGADSTLIEKWEKALGLDALLNRKGTTWRGLSDADRAAASDKAVAVMLMSANPSLIKRPLISVGGECHAGFSDAGYQNIFKV